ncbi:hypothetical protein AUEXF2481DRAFT_35369 [Aureobasidium subglaciale EXF-2481]|uniref:Uncharacterized protein n=1 Tax=Aureobasidium subglaciale (strain EXF-2481) TaxID=1043005 RepID=A0A074YNS7_AURSE|nr:uncharacterized protein AUEXF2481DRAFT_35369 [Aureobasidium subglaciale EXF-2481]KEQ99458.1 hypothetical protein AUEXF2481DRAFT_35369 [Aureobasidium subglaciale EXF-2481]
MLHDRIAASKNIVRIHILCDDTLSQGRAIVNTPWQTQASHYSTGRIRATTIAEMPQWAWRHDYGCRFYRLADTATRNCDNRIRHGSDKTSSLPSHRPRKR